MSDDEGSLIEVSHDFLFDDPNVSYYEDDEFRNESKVSDDSINGDDVYQPHTFEELEEQLQIMATERNLKKRPSSRDRVSKQMRPLVQTPKSKLFVQKLKQSLPEITTRRDFEDLLESILFLEYVEKNNSMIPRQMVKFPFFSNVSTAFDSFNRDLYLFSSVFGGFEPFEVIEMAYYLLPSDGIQTRRHGKCSSQFTLLVILSRFKQEISGWSLMGYFFSMDPSKLCDIFISGTQLLYEKYADLLSLDSIRLLTPNFISKCQSAFSQKYSKNTRGKILPQKFRKVSALMDGTRFEICRPGRAQNKIQESFYSGYVKVHNILCLVIILPNGLRIYASVASGRNIDTTLVTPELKDTLEIADVWVLADGLFHSSRTIRALERSLLEDHIYKGLASIRVPMEWSFAYVQEFYPLLKVKSKMKLFQTRPVILIFVALLLSNFRCCFRGENASIYFQMSPPSFLNYILKTWEND